MRWGKEVQNSIFSMILFLKINIYQQVYLHIKNI